MTLVTVTVICSPESFPVRVIAEPVEAFEAAVLAWPALVPVVGAVLFPVFTV
jgi:hypothetical protein